MNCAGKLRTPRATIKLMRQAPSAPQSSVFSCTASHQCIGHLDGPHLKSLRSQRGPVSGCPAFSCEKSIPVIHSRAMSQHGCAVMRNVGRGKVLPRSRCRHRCRLPAVSFQINHHSFNLCQIHKTCSCRNRRRRRKSEHRPAACLPAVRRSRRLHRAPCKAGPSAASCRA